MRAQREALPAGEQPAARGTGSRPWHEDLAHRLEALRVRAALEEWPHWSAEEMSTVAEAAREIQAIPMALARGMQEAFVAGREYGHHEERLDELNREISVLSSLLAQHAWGRSPPGEA